MRELKLNQQLETKFTLQIKTCPIHLLMMGNLQQTIQGAAAALFVRRFGAFATVIAVA